MPKIYNKIKPTSFRVKAVVIFFFQYGTISGNISSTFREIIGMQDLKSTERRHTDFICFPESFSGVSTPSPNRYHLFYLKVIKL